MLLGSISNTNGNYNPIGDRSTKNGGNFIKLSKLKETFFQTLRSHPYGLTESSMILSSQAISSICISLCTGVAIKPLLVQYSSGVICIEDDLSNNEIESTIDTTLVAIKRTIGQIRFLFILPSSFIYSTTISSEDKVPLRDIQLSHTSTDYIEQIRGLSTSLSGNIQDLAPLLLSGITTYSTSTSPLHSVSNDLSIQGVLQFEHKFENLCSWIQRQIRSAHSKLSISTSSTSNSSNKDTFVSLNSLWNLEAVKVEDEKELNFKLKRIDNIQGHDLIIQREFIDHMLMLPTSSVIASSKRPREEETEEKGDVIASDTRKAKVGNITSKAEPSSASSSSQNDVVLAVIVPFRDQPEQNRALQLSKFAERLPIFLQTVHPTLKGFHIIVVEQSNDGYKFNRGKALNAGFIMATATNRADLYGSGFSQHFNSFCFHDVDLLPGSSLGPWYAKYPERPIHVGSAWGRYPYPNYIGGILTLSYRDVRACNGFPNNFWGWGGEDDEMFARLRDANLLPVEKVPAGIAASENIIEDLEETIIKEKGGERAGTSVKDGGRVEWRNMLKHEGIERHASTWRSNGINLVDFTVSKIRHLNEYVTVITVDLKASIDEMAQKQSEDRK
jgi:hypothetical protein